MFELSEEGDDAQILEVNQVSLEPLLDHNNKNMVLEDVKSNENDELGENISHIDD